MPKLTDPEFRAIRRRASISTNLELALIGLLFFGLVEGAASLTTQLSAFFGLSAEGQITVAVGLVVVVAAALAFVIWSFSRKTEHWSDDLKNVVSLDRFLKYDPAKRNLAPNLDEQQQKALLANLQTIAAR